MKRAGIADGADRHLRFERLLDAQIRTESDLRSWMQASFPSFNSGRWDACRKKADEFLQSGVLVFDPRLATPRLASPRRGRPATPRRGLPHSPVCQRRPGFRFPFWPYSIPENRESFLPDSNWLGALRFFFNTLEPREVGLGGKQRDPYLQFGPAYAPCVPEYHRHTPPASSAEGRPGIVEYIRGGRSIRSGAFVHARRRRMFRKTYSTVSRPDACSTGESASSARNPLRREPSGDSG